MAADMFGAFTPAAGDQRWLHHLLRRTSFGVTVKGLEANAGKSPSEVVDGLLNYDAEQDPLNHLLEDMEGFLTPFAEAKQLQGWWVYRIIKTPRPFQERLAIFWHNRFATSAGKVEQIVYMHNQIELFRRKGLGNYRDLLIAVGRDPAMLVWLDGNTSKKGKPNENYARELMELFSLGIGNYTENDVKEVARAFTGWTIKSNAGFLDTTRRDNDEKTVFGVKANFDDEKIVDLILGKPVAATFLSRKLLQEFVLPNPTDEMVEHYAAALKAAKWELKPVIRAMLTSKLFYSEAAYRAKIKSPVELVVGAVQMMHDMGGKAAVDQSVKSMTGMGQAILYPPSVKGWDGEQMWINANTMLVRMNYALGVSAQRGKEFTRKSDPLAFLTKREITSADKIIEHFARVLLDGQLPEGARDKYAAYLNTDDKGKNKAFVLSAETVSSRVRPLMHMMMTLPEYQLA